MHKLRGGLPDRRLLDDLRRHHEELSLAPSRRDGLRSALIRRREDIRGVGADLTAVIHCLETLGLAAFWVGYTRADLGIPVVAVFVPGLQDARHA